MRTLDPKTKHNEPDEDNWAYEEDFDSEEFEYFGLAERDIEDFNEIIEDDLWGDLSDDFDVD